MKRLLALLAAATVLTSPALAQHHGHHMPGHKMPAPKAKPKPAPKPATRKPAARKAAPKAKPLAKAKPAPKKAVRRPATKPGQKASPKPKAVPVDPHAGHRMDAPSAATPKAADPHAGHHMPATPAPDPHAGHNMPAAPAAPASDPHGGHGIAAEAPAPPVAPPPQAAFSGPEHAADAIFAPEQMAASREEMRDEHGGMDHSKLLIDQLEARFRKGRDGYRWDGQAWYGGDIDKFWLKTEGEGAFGEAVEEAEVQALWSHAIDPWFDLQAGIRYDFRPDPERVYAVLGVQGLAPYWFEVDAAAFVSNKGDIHARLEAEYDLRLTQKLILQPRTEIDLALQDVPELGIGSGLSTGEIGARLRYEFRPEFSPYVGIGYERAFGDTADFRQAAGDHAGGWNLLVGLRTWF